MEKIFLENVSDLAESQRISFFNFLHKGISTELNSLPNPFEPRKHKNFFFNKLKLSQKKGKTQKIKGKIAKLKEEKKPKLIPKRIGKKKAFLTKESKKEFRTNLKTFFKSLNQFRYQQTFFYPDEIKVKGPYESFQESIIKRQTYCIQIFVTLYFVPLSEWIQSMPRNRKLLESYRKSRKFRVQKDLLLTELPLITDEGTFLITGIERIVVNQIIRSPGVYLRKEYGSSKLKMIHTATIISDRGIWVKMIMDKDEIGRDQIYIKLNDLRGKSGLATANDDMEEDPNKMSIFHFLKFFQISRNEIADALNYPEDWIAKEDLITRELAKKTSVELKAIILRLFYNSKNGCFSIGQVGRFKMNKRLGLNLSKEITYVTGVDLLLILDKLLELRYSNIPMDEIDHIKNKQIRSIGDFLQMQLRVGLTKSFEPFEVEEPLGFADIKYETESITKLDKKAFVKRRYFDPYPISSSIKEFFKVSQLSQFMDQINPLSEITQKRKVSVFGPNGLKRDNVSIQIRDIHPSQYGRLCPVETPEGQNAGLINSIAMHSRISPLGWLETPYYIVNEGKINPEEAWIYLNPEQESKLKVAFCDTALTKNHSINNPYLSTKEDSAFSVQKKEESSLLTVSPLQLLSVATSLIPFIEHDDANRALMGSNMQRQAVPLLCPQKAIVGTGLESAVLMDSIMVLKNYSEGYVKNANCFFIDISDKNNQVIRYYLHKYFRSNQETSLNQKPCVWQGEKVFSGQIIGDAASSIDGELALGRNLTIAYMPWEGYNYEDAIVLSERLVLEDCLSSVHIEEYETKISESLQECARRSQHLHSLPKKVMRKLDENGIITLGSYVKEYDILYANVVEDTAELTPEKRFELAIKNQKYSVKDASFKMPHGSEGRVIEIRLFPSLFQYEKEIQEDDLDIGLDFDFESVEVCMKMRFFVCQNRKIQIGDKLAGRHGNKGIISRILPRQDMPYLPNGKPIDIIFNPLGVPSRMNVGQIFEALLGFAGENLGKRFKVKSFDEVYGEEASRILVTQKLKQASLTSKINWLFSDISPGKILLRDGRTGDYFDNPITVGKSYILKLIHLVEDKIHARDTGPYSMITEQPLGGKALKGGQRLGEMEVWALEAYGASYTLQELLTIKSDDMEGRMKIFESLVSPERIEKPIPSMPETFLVLIRELNALGLEFSLNQAREKKENSVEYSTDFVDIFEKIETRLKLKALYQRKQSQLFTLKSKEPNLAEKKEQQYILGKRKVLESLTDFTNMFEFPNVLEKTFKNYTKKVENEEEKQEKDDFLEEDYFSSRLKNKREKDEESYE